TGLSGETALHCIEGKIFGPATKIVGQQLRTSDGRATKDHRLTWQARACITRWPRPAAESGETMVIDVNSRSGARGGDGVFQSSLLIRQAVDNAMGRLLESETTPADSECSPISVSS
ncbi:MAG: hypothetical protein KDA81_18915, partial [Planctomycetaceae bacterium]|nr:hypothetical protein [Planctomycetaceae bacterium]